MDRPVRLSTPRKGVIFIFSKDEYSPGETFPRRNSGIPLSSHEIKTPAESGHFGYPFIWWKLKFQPNESPIGKPSTLSNRSYTLWTKPARAETRRVQKRARDRHRDVRKAP
jgi:hypothetical protein